LGWDAPWYIVELFAVGYAPLSLFVIGLAWLAAAGQLAALAADRYAPYPAPGERPRRGPLRELIRTLVFAPRRRAPAMADARRAVNEQRVRRRDAASGLSSRPRARRFHVECGRARPQQPHARSCATPDR